jgi:L-alanine-DL-glutamate epimerase-like enolase superfamily enzyme
MSFRFVPLHLKLKFEWKLSRNTAIEKHNFLVIYEQNGIAGFGEIAPNIRYGETPELIVENMPRCTFLPEDESPAYFEDSLRDTDLPACMRAGLSHAYYHWHQQQKPPSIKDTSECSTLFTIPVMEPGMLASFIHTHKLGRFKMLKLKVNAEMATDLVTETLKHTNYSPLLIDGNEAWQDPDTFIYWLEKIKKYPVYAIEQPFAAALKDEMLYVKPYCKHDLIADESCLEYPDWSFLKAAFSIINIKLMKTGGIHRALQLQQIAHKEGLKTMAGCMVETSVGIYHALEVARLAEIVDLDGFMLIENEEFNVLEERNGNIFVKNFQKILEKHIPT